MRRSWPARIRRGEPDDRADDLVWVCGWSFWRAAHPGYESEEEYGSQTNLFAAMEQGDAGRVEELWNNDIAVSPGDRPTTITTGPFWHPLVPGPHHAAPYEVLDRQTPRAALSSTSCTPPETDRP